MLTYIVITVAIIAAICFIPLLRTILRWILFLPISLLAGILIPYIDIPNLILSWIVSQISSFLGLIFDTIDIFLSFALLSYLGRVICPSSKIGWYVSFGTGLLLCIYSLLDMHVFSMITIGERDASSSIEPIIWWHVMVLAAAAILGAWAAKTIDVDWD